MTDMSRIGIGSGVAGVVKSMGVAAAPGCTVVMSLSLGGPSVGLECEPENDTTHWKVRKHEDTKGYLLPPTVRYIDHELSALLVALLRGHWWIG